MSTEVIDPCPPCPVPPFPPPPPPPLFFTNRQQSILLLPVAACRCRCRCLSRTSTRPDSTRSAHTSGFAFFTLTLPTLFVYHSAFSPLQVFETPLVSRQSPALSSRICLRDYLSVLLRPPTARSLSTHTELNPLIRPYPVVAPATEEKAQVQTPIQTDDADETDKDGPTTGVPRELAPASMFHFAAHSKGPRSVGVVARAKSHRTSHFL
ncbi:hypothetical protein LX36DRAFT_143971 [Colletotrichum falcatum]|nr:hypothetical protein LX36DRAFT_143971 [Colletotrichum falcatum]